MVPHLSKLGRRIAAVAALAAGLALGAGTACAAPGFSVTVAGPGVATVGKPILLRASGKDPSPTESWFQYYLQVEAIPASVIGSCPPDYLQAVQLSGQSGAAGGDHLVGPQYHLRDEGGYWSAPFAYTPVAAGRILICSYTQNISNTLATHQHVVGVAARGKRCKKPKQAKRRAAGTARKCRKRR